MTPFDGAALLAALLTFYPIVTIANLRRARLERAEYFAGGELFGTCGEKLRLPDGRVFDLMFDCGGPSARWQVIEPGPDTGGGGGEFALEDGPLTPIDLAPFDPAPPAHEFEQLAAGALLELGAGEDVLDLAADTMSAAGAGAGTGDRLSSALEAAAESRVDSDRALTELRPEELIDASAGADEAIEGERREFPDPSENVPEEIPPNDPGPEPPDDQRSPEV